MDQSAITAEVLLPCGCLFSADEDEIVSHCPRHVCNAAMRFAEQDAKRCPFCGSLKTVLSPAGLHRDCVECECRFPRAQQ